VHADKAIRCPIRELGYTRKRLTRVVCKQELVEQRAAFRLTQQRLPQDRTISSVCFDCGQRSLKEQERRDSEGRLLREVHQLLRCTNAQCCRWWTRDVLGALNIGKQGLHFLRHGCMHPCFTQVV
jgi:hypothetical protein